MKTPIKLLKQGKVNQERMNDLMKHPLSDRFKFKKVDEVFYMWHTRYEGIVKW